MTHRQTETSREIRLWIGQVIVPTVALVVAVMSKPETRNFVVTKSRRVTNAIKRKFKKSEA